MSQNFDWEKIPEYSAELIFDQGSRFLSAQMDFVVAADQRAMTFAGMMTAITTAILGAAFLGPSVTSLAFVYAASVAGIASAASAGCALMASRPGKFNYPAVRPSERLHLSMEWFTMSRRSMLIGEAFAQQQHIEANELVLDGLMNWYRGALIFAGSIPVLAVVAWASVWAWGG